MATLKDIETAKPHKIFAATLELARTNGDEELLGVTAWLIIQMKWNKDHAELVAEAVEDYYTDSSWFIAGPEDSEDSCAEDEHAKALDASMPVVLLNRLMLHLDGEPHWHIEPPHEKWGDPEWRHSTWDEPDVSIVNCGILVEQGEYSAALDMLKEMMYEPDIFFYSEEPDGTMTAFSGLCMTIDLHLEQATTDKNETASKTLLEMDDMVLGLVGEDKSDDEASRG